MPFDNGDMGVHELTCQPLAAPHDYGGVPNKNGSQPRSHRRLQVRFVFLVRRDELYPIVLIDGCHATNLVDWLGNGPMQHRSTEQ